MNNQNAMKDLTTIISCLWFLLTAWHCSAQVKDGQKDAVDRQAVFAGQFYPDDAGELKSTLKDFFSQAVNKQSNTGVAALIAPHAGYPYSGQVAASAYNQLDPQSRFDNIFILAPSHRVSFEGASIYHKGDYRTPLGKVTVNRKLASKLIDEHDVFVFNEAAHSKEHSLEVQLPFLQYYLKQDFRVVPVVIGTQDQATLRKMADILAPYFNENNLFIISSDFSHYPEYNDAKEVDHATAAAITKNSPNKLVQTLRSNAKKDISNLATSMCGWAGAYTLLNITKNRSNISIEKIQYKNSGDVTSRKNRVVGYWAISFSRENNKKQHTMNFQLNEREKKTLLNIARKSLEGYIRNKRVPDFDKEEISETLKRETGVFVTLQKKEELRGCIGRFEADIPLYKLVGKMAITSATQDMRFPPVSEEELDEITIEISVLTPMEKIQSIDEIKLGTHGIYVKKGPASGTLLPQVADKYDWTREEFLGHCARDKAGIGWDGWKDAEVYTYRAIVFSEEELKT
jgi:AmmeMemoRadiSam system protein B/AmmeMemoRadiSam system protein A